jgi:signal transduction histidine kinase
MRGRNSLKILYISLFIIATLIFTETCTSAANAQTLPNNTLTLNNSEQRIFLSGFLYATPHDQANLNANTIATRYVNNLRGTRIDEKMLNINAENTALWLAFSIKNSSMNDNWILHFGDTSDARQAFVKDIMVFEHNTQTMLFNSTQGEEEKDMPAANMHEMQNNALPLKIQQGKQHLYIIKIAHEGPFTGTIAPSLMTKSYYVGNLQKNAIFTTGFKIIMLLFCGFILAIAFTKKAFAYLTFGIYTLLQVSLITAIDSNFIAPYGIMPDIITLLLIATIFAKWLSTQIFFNKTSYDDKSMLALVSVGGGIMVCFIISLFINNTASILNHTLVMAPIFIAVLTGLIFSIILAYSNRTDSLYLVGSWLALFTAFSFQIATSYNLIAATAFNINIFWVMVIVQSALYIVAAINKINLDEQEDQVKKAKESRASQAMARLQQSKENSDQARLLRVIERERELMSELREREMLRTEEMRKAKNMADEANRAKSAFLAVVSHEVRTPMNGIMGMIRLLLDTQMTKQQTEYLGTMQTSGEGMMALLNDILDFEKIESGNMELESIEFDMTKLVQDVVTLMTGHAAEKETQLLTNIAPNFPRTLKGDPTRLRQILLNLVSNANKFTDKGTVTIHLQAK